MGDGAVDGHDRWPVSRAGWLGLALLALAAATVAAVLLAGAVRWLLQA